MGKEYVVTIDERGRLTIPKEVRAQIRAKKLRLRVEGERLVLEPVAEDVDKYYGVFRKDLLGDVDIDKALEEALVEVLSNDKNEK